MLPPKKRSKAAAADTGSMMEVAAWRVNPRLLTFTSHRQSSSALCSAFLSLYTDACGSRAEQLASLPLSDSSLSLLLSSTAWDTGSGSAGRLWRLRKPMLTPHAAQYAQFRRHGTEPPEADPAGLHATGKAGSGL